MQRLTRKNARKEDKERNRITEKERKQEKIIRKFYFFAFAFIKKSFTNH